MLWSKEKIFQKIDFYVTIGAFDQSVFDEWKARIAAAEPKIGDYIFTVLEDDYKNRIEAHIRACDELSLTPETFRPFECSLIKLSTYKSKEMLEHIFYEALMDQVYKDMGKDVIKKNNASDIPLLLSTIKELKDALEAEEHSRQASDFKANKLEKELEKSRDVIIGFINNHLMFKSESFRTAKEEDND